jgi:nitrite reductase (NADH) large subunit
VRKGDLLATVETSEEAIRLSLGFLQHYRESAEYLERTYAYLDRVGVDFVRSAVLDDIDALLDRYRIAKAAADPDPWRERHAPVHPRQFAELDT